MSNYNPPVNVPPSGYQGPHDDACQCETCENKRLKEKIAGLTGIKPESLPQTRLHIGRRTEAIKDLPSGTIIRGGDLIGILSRGGDTVFFTTLPKFETEVLHYDAENVEVIGFLNITVDGK